MNVIRYKDGEVFIDQLRKKISNYKYVITKEEGDIKAVYKNPNSSSGIFFWDWDSLNVAEFDDAEKAAQFILDVEELWSSLTHLLDAEDETLSLSYLLFNNGGKND